MKYLTLIATIFLLPTYTYATSYSILNPLESANALAKKGIIVDRSNNPELYKLEQTIQRQAIMKIVMKVSNLEIPDSCTWEFNDVNTKDWPCKYIEAALKAWYITKNNSFRPYDSVTKTEAMKLVLKSKGIQKIQQTSNWQADYMITAYEYGIIENKYYDYNAPASRWWIFQIANASIIKQTEVLPEQKIISDEAL